MLYVTTRNNNDAYTVYKAMSEDVASDRGGYVPFRIPTFDSADLMTIAKKSFADCVATILNLFFTAKLSAWDVEFAIGRNPLRLVQLSRNVAVAELWVNPEESIDSFVMSLHKHITHGRPELNRPTQWTEIAVRIAMLFGVWSEMIRQNVITADDHLDISVSGDSYYTLAALLYAHKMGLPIDSTIVACKEGSALWDLIMRGGVKADALSSPESNLVERLLQCVLNCQECDRYLRCRECIEQYTLPEGADAEIRKKLFAASIGNTRYAATISNIAKKDGYALNRSTAYAYGGLEDFRAHKGVDIRALLISESRN